MKYNRLLVLIAIAGCQPKYTSGKTECSDKKECPSGYSCSDDGTSSKHYCIDNTKLSCPSDSRFYCSQSNTCWSQPGACSTVTLCGTAKNPGSVICATPGWVPDCNGSTCSPAGSAGTGGSKDAGLLGTGGALGTGGIKTTIVSTGGAFGTGGSKDAGVGTGGVFGSGGAKTTIVGTGGISGGGGDAGVIRDANVNRDVATADVAPDLAGRDAVALCAFPCPLGQQCYSGQCCVPPAAGGNCTVNPSCGCPSGQVCYPSLTTKAMACFAANNVAEGADCTGNLLCQTGFGCFGGICKRYCSTISDCPTVGGVRSCDQAIWSSDKSDILGVMLCERVCDPAHPQSPTAPLLACPTGFNCSSDSTGVSYCFKASPLPVGSICSGEADCPAGYYCTTSGSCSRYCLSSSDCPGSTCQFTWSPSEYAGSYIVGYCK
jgi:hypothetical protein